MANEIVFDVKENIGVVSKSATGWLREVNLISWNNGPAKVDIRDWDQDHLHMSKGITLREDEAQKVMELLRCYFDKHAFEGEETLAEDNPQ